MMRLHRCTCINTSTSNKIHLPVFQPVHVHYSYMSHDYSSTIVRIAIRITFVLCIFASRYIGMITSGCSGHARFMSHFITFSTYLSHFMNFLVAVAMHYISCLTFFSIPVW